MATISHRPEAIRIDLPQGKCLRMTVSLPPVLEAARSAVSREIESLMQPETDRVARAVVDNSAVTRRMASRIMAAEESIEFKRRDIEERIATLEILQEQLSKQRTLLLEVERSKRDAEAIHAVHLRSLVSSWQASARSIHDHVVTQELKRISNGNESRESKSDSSEESEEKEPDLGTRAPLKNMKIVQLKNGKWELRYTTVDGKSRTIRTDARTEAEAHQLFDMSGCSKMAMVAQAAKLNANMIRALCPEMLPLTLMEAVQRYCDLPWWSSNTRVWNRQVVHQFMKFTKAATINEFTAENVDRFINRPGSMRFQYRRQTHVVLRGFSKFLFNKGWLPEHAAMYVRVNRENMQMKDMIDRIYEPFTEAEMDYLLDVTHPSKWPIDLWSGSVQQNRTEKRHWQHFMFAMGRWTGMRSGDIARLEWSSISEDLQTIRIKTRKTGAIVNLAIHPRLRDAILASRPKGRQDGFVFPKFTNPGRGQLGRAIREDFGLKAGKPFHSFRRTYIANAAAQGIPLPHIASAVGHSPFGDFAMTRRYLAVTNSPPPQSQLPSPTHVETPSI